MTLRIAVLAAALVAPGLLAQTGTTTKGPKKKDDSPPGYKKDNLRGFVLYFSDEVLKEDRESKLERTPLEALERELIIVEQVLPADKVKSLKAVPIWVEWNETLAMGNGRGGRAVAVFYGGQQANLLGNKNPLTANAVTILSLKSLSNEHQPKTDSGRCVTLHELAHAFHHHVVGDNPLVKSTFRQAMERKLYDPNVYAATNEREYFAELSCAYLDRLDYFPRTRDELKKHDPKGYELMEKTWGKPPEKKGPAAAAKGPKLPSPDGDGKFPLGSTTERLRLGPEHFGKVPARADWKGQPVLVFLFRAASGRALAQLPRLNAWQDEFRDHGLIAVAAETDGAPAEVAQKLARQRALSLPVVDDVEIGVAGTFALPHALLYDHTGRCVFRGTLLDAEPYVRTAVGKAVLARVGKESFAKPAQPVVDLLEQGSPMPQVFAKLAEQLRATGKDAADELKELQTAMTDGGRKVLDAAAERAKDDPVGAFFDAERLPTAYRGTPLEKPAFDFVNKLKGNPKVGSELRARPSLEAIKKIDTQLSGRDLGFNPRLPEFRENNSILLKQLEDAVEKIRKAYPTARATEDAIRIAERWEVKVK